MHDLAYLCGLYWARGNWWLLLVVDDREGVKSPARLSGSANESAAPRSRLCVRSDQKRLDLLLRLPINGLVSRGEDVGLAGVETLRILDDPLARHKSKPGCVCLYPQRPSGFGIYTIPVVGVDLIEVSACVHPNLDLGQVVSIPLHRLAILSDQPAVLHQ